MDYPARTVCTLGIALLLHTTAFAGAKLIVSNDGSDSLNCGTAANPCRSISQAIQNAGSGDTIIVGPGRYGDLNNNGGFTDPGDEMPGDGGMIAVTKAVTIESRDGADVTLLDAGTNGVSTVVIAASGAVFGAKGKGFTLMGKSFFSDGLIIELGANHVTVEGNRAVAMAFDGFATTADSSSNRFIGNVAVGCGKSGFRIDGSDYFFQGNVAVGNAQGGFSYTGTNLVFTQNAIIGNIQGGFGGDNLASGGSSAIGNSFIGNLDFGIDVSGTFTVSGNNIFGNDPILNCGLYSDNTFLTAPKNFFGAATGPGPSPANNACGTNINATSFATKEIKIKLIKP